MHPVQAAPRQRGRSCADGGRSGDAPRAGSAEAKVVLLKDLPGVQQDAPRAGSAEAKADDEGVQRGGRGCTPCRQRRGKEPHQDARLVRTAMYPVQAAHSEITTCRPMVL